MIDINEIKVHRLLPIEKLLMHIMTYDMNSLTVVELTHIVSNRKSFVISVRNQRLLIVSHERILIDGSVLKYVNINEQIELNDVGKYGGVEVRIGTMLNNPDWYETICLRYKSIDELIEDVTNGRY